MLRKTKPRRAEPGINTVADARRSTPGFGVRQAVQALLQAALSAWSKAAPRSLLPALPLILLQAAAPAAMASEALATFVELATGSFDSSAQAKTDKRYDAVTWHIAEVWADDDPDVRWLYSENWLGESDKPYRQRISRVSAQPDGTVLNRGYRLPDGERYVGAWKNPALLDALDRDTLEATAGCDVVLARTGPRRFEGATDGHRCRSSYKGASYVVSRSVIADDEYVNWDRGFTAAGELAWGPAAGGYRLRRQGKGNSCDTPVRMLVYGDIYDREKFRGYVKAIGASGLYPELQGYYEAITPALDVFEGEPPPTRGVVISRFPCLEAAQQFWQSPRYREIVPLRQGIAEFEVIVLPALPVPEYIRP